jgi:hypothetical protein
VSLHTCRKLEQYNRQQEPVSPDDLALPAGMRLLVYGLSYLNEVTEAIVGAHMFAGNVSITDASVNSTEESTNCVPPEERLSRAPAHSIAVDISRRYAKYEFSSGAVLVAVNNYGPLQLSLSKSRLQALMVEHDFTHVVYMSPHSDDYFNARCLSTDPSWRGLDPRQGKRAEAFEGMRCPSDHGVTPSGYLDCVYGSVQFQTISKHILKRFHGAARLTIFMPFNFNTATLGPSSGTHQKYRTFYPGDFIAKVGSCRSQGSHESVVVCVNGREHIPARQEHPACIQGPILPVSKQLLHQIHMATVGIHRKALSRPSEAIARRVPNLV